MANSADPGGDLKVRQFRHYFGPVNLTSPLFATPHAPYAMHYLVSMLAGFRLVLAIRCHAGSCRKVRIALLWFVAPAPDALEPEISGTAGGADEEDSVTVSSHSRAYAAMKGLAFGRQRQIYGVLVHRMKAAVQWHRLILTQSFSCASPTPLPQCRVAWYASYRSVRRFVLIGSTFWLWCAQTVHQVQRASGLFSSGNGLGEWRNVNIAGTDVVDGCCGLCSRLIAAEPWWTWVGVRDKSDSGNGAVTIQSLTGAAPSTST